MAGGNGSSGGAGIGRVMVGTDRSETAERAVEWAAAFAERYTAELHVVQVVIPAHPADTEHGAAEVTRAREPFGDSALRKFTVTSTVISLSL